MQKKPRLLTKEELARELRVQVSTIERYVRKGRIPAVRPSHSIVRFDLEDVVAALKRQPSTCK